MFRVDADGDRVKVYLQDRLVISHSPENPFVHAGKGKSHVSNRESRWHVSDSQEARTALIHAAYDHGRNVIRLSGGDLSLSFHLSEVEGNLVLTPQRATTGVNRLWLSFPASPGACVYGAGAQYSDLDLRGKRVPIWVRETRLQQGQFHQVTAMHGAGGHLSSFPMPTFVTEDHLFYHFDTSSFATLDFKSSRAHRIELWELPNAIVLGAHAGPADLMRQLTRLLGRQTVLPNWCIDGVWLEVQDGLASMVSRLEAAMTAGVNVTAILIRDWSGGRDTPAGRRVFWDWVWNRDLYPRLDEVNRELTARNVRTLAYINPHLAIEGRLFAEASLKGFLIRKSEGGNYISDMGGFMAGHLDLTNPDACRWYKELIKQNILGLGFCGYMADLGQYLPADAVLFSKESPLRLHNRWPVLWARLNREAVREAGRTGDVVFFTQSGYTGSGGASMLTSTGEQSTGWGMGDGLPSAVTASLTLACSGIGLSHSDIGGNVSRRHAGGKELFLRWAEFSMFTPVMRLAHHRESDKNWQFDSDEETLQQFARMSGIHAKIAPYLRACVKENAADGMPVIRPMHMMYPHDPRVRRDATQYLLGEELLVAPVTRRGADKRKVYLPAGEWVHLWTGREYTSEEVEIDAPIGKPPVFYQREGKHAPLFAELMLE